LFSLFFDEKILQGIFGILGAAIWFLSFKADGFGPLLCSITAGVYVILVAFGIQIKYDFTNFSLGIVVVAIIYIGTIPVVKRFSVEDTERGRTANNQESYTQPKTEDIETKKICDDCIHLWPCNEIKSGEDTIWDKEYYSYKCDFHDWRWTFMDFQIYNKNQYAEKCPVYHKIR